MVKRIVYATACAGIQIVLYAVFCCSPIVMFCMISQSELHLCSSKIRNGLRQLQTAADETQVIRFYLIAVMVEPKPFSFLL